MRSKKIFIPMLFMALLVLCAASGASALTITPNTTPQWSTFDTSNFDSDALETFLSNEGETPGELTMLYKANVGTGEEVAPFQNSYDTAFSNTSTDPEDAIISYIANTPFISGSPIYLYVKDGNAPKTSGDPAAYVFDLVALNWNGQEQIILDGFWPNQGAISNVAIHGRTVSVPEPSILFFIGLNLSGLFIIRKKIIRK